MCCAFKDANDFVKPYAILIHAINGKVSTIGPRLDKPCVESQISLQARPFVRKRERLLDASWACLCVGLVGGK